MTARTSYEHNMYVQCTLKDVKVQQKSHFYGPTQPVCTCSKSIIETPEQCEICSKLTIRTPERHQKPGFFIVNL